MIDAAEVRRLAALARLEIEPQRAEALAAQLASILRHLEALPTGEPHGAEACSTPPAGPDALREDEVAPIPLLLPAPELAPEWARGFFTVPRVLPFEPEP